MNESSRFAAPSLAPGAPVATRTWQSLFTFALTPFSYSCSSSSPMSYGFCDHRACNDEHERSHQRDRLLEASPAGFRRYCCSSSCQNQNERAVPGPHPGLPNWRPIFDVLALDPILRGPVRGASVHRKAHPNRIVQLRRHVRTKFSSAGA